MRTQLIRSNDMVRAIYTLDYTVLDTVEYSRFALFQMAADGYADNGFTEAAYGDATGEIDTFTIPNHNTTGYASTAHRGIAITGEAPWTMLYNSNKTDGNLPEHLADIGFVVRDYARIQTVFSTQPHTSTSFAH